jgi:hypothetical protein
MNAFAAAMAALVADTNMAEAITYYAGGSGPGVALRAIRTAPDAAEFAFGQSVVQATDVLNLAVADLAQVAVGDVFLLADGSQLTVVAEPMRDNINIAWRVMCRR